jgi:hypothetical protein
LWSISAGKMALMELADKDACVLRKSGIAMLEAFFDFYRNL